MRERQRLPGLPACRPSFAWLPRECGLIGSAAPTPLPAGSMKRLLLVCALALAAARVADAVAAIGAARTLWLPVYRNPSTGYVDCRVGGSALAVLAILNGCATAPACA